MLARSSRGGFSVAWAWFLPLEHLVDVSPGPAGIFTDMILDPIGLWIDIVIGGAEYVIQEGIQVCVIVDAISCYAICRPVFQSHISRESACKYVFNHANKKRYTDGLKKRFYDCERPRIIPFPKHTDEKKWKA